MHLAKAARIIGIVGGIGAVAWAMRDRFVTLALSREPEHPTFTLPPEPPDSVATDPDDLTVIGGIGPVFARRLMEVGIATYENLAGATPGRLAGIINVTEARAGKWIEDAARLVNA
ncbi:MAG: helix-hairpin-helix domain-containing protein [Acidimicrobiia bacterium]|nr:helix-hairpin-helix domain-containing protein [Acidimicrobiia bacterium]